MKKPIRVTSLELGINDRLLNVPNLELINKLARDNDTLLETDAAFWLFKDNLAFRCLKESAKPLTFHCTDLQINPDSCRVRATISVEEMFAHSLKNEIPLLETASEYYICGDVTLVAKKPKGGE
ncbi:MAG: hypothetical protein WCD81_08585 [Candidatus Bathyarchaeia archaeon]